jgi:hypothetical protein
MKQRGRGIFTYPFSFRRAFGGRMEKSKKHSVIPADDWQARDDAHELMRHNALRLDKPRMKRAMDLMRRTLEAEDSRTGTKRKTGRTSARNSGRR